MKDKEFDKLMRQKLEPYEIDFQDGKKNLGWTAIEGQLPSNWWYTLWQAAKPWLWVPVLTTIAVLNYFWWQQTQQIHTDTNRLIHTIEKMHWQIDSLEFHIKNLPEKSRVDTVYILNETSQYASYPYAVFQNHASQNRTLANNTQNAGVFGNNYSIYGNQKTDAFNSFMKKNQYDTNYTNSRNTILSDSSDTKYQGQRENKTNTSFYAEEQKENSTLAIKGNDTDKFTANSPNYFDSTYAVLNSLEKIPLIEMDSIIVRHEKIKEIPMREAVEKESFHLGKTLGKLLPIQSKWGLSTGLSTPRPEQGEAYVAPSVGLQGSFLYSEHWRVSLGALYERRGYELYEVYEGDYGESFIQRFPGLEDFQQEDYIEDIESKQNRVVIPLQLRYFFKKGRIRMRPFVGIGWLVSFNIAQELEYRFEDEEDYDDEPFNPKGFPSGGEGNRNGFHGSAAEITLGLEYALSRKWTLQWSAYYQNEFAPSNVELNKLNTVGMRLSILYGR